MKNDKLHCPHLYVTDKGQLISCSNLAGSEFLPTANNPAVQNDAGTTSARLLIGSVSLVDPVVHLSAVTYCNCPPIQSNHTHTLETCASVPSIVWPGELQHSSQLHQTHKRPSGGTLKDKWRSLLLRLRELCQSCQISWKCCPLALIQSNVVYREDLKNTHTYSLCHKNVIHNWIF